ncbi:hypothetical protein Tdes44962_MAKER05016 [Teratosphaeria destructans]|uniref:Uncharacterized protein n=1 Tax=Teratosphaeria destructans TaxID=418781 RepID=A0A9W7SL20_9PEZI|nr:hypothetical protein Tdes44962_MAKER05016 [Teratosphaeria destructans]
MLGVHGLPARDGHGLSGTFPVEGGGMVAWVLACGAFAVKLVSSRTVSHGAGGIAVLQKLENYHPGQMCKLRRAMK